MTCPICKKPVPAGGEDQPFCTARCRVIDLGNWASEKYVISEPIPYSDDFEIPEPPPSPDDPL
jgi:uncharacterized protein